MFFLSKPTQQMDILLKEFDNKLSYYKNSPVLDKLEFTKIREMLAAECSSSLGKKRASMCFPSEDQEQIVAWQEETAEIV